MALPEGSLGMERIDLHRLATQLTNARLLGLGGALQTGGKFDGVSVLHDILRRSCRL
jgi:hypothetical protein